MSAKCLRVAAIIVIIGHHTSDQVCELAEHAPRRAGIDRELVHAVVNRGAPMARGDMRRSW
jgi:hypothetical protein